MYGNAEKKKPRMSRKDREVMNVLSKRYVELRMSMNHEAAMKQLRREVEANNDAVE